MKITLYDGKYEYVSENGKQVAYRYGEIWRDLTGDNLAYAMACKIEQLEQQRNELASKVERLRNLIIECNAENKVPCDIDLLLDETKPVALAAMKAKWQAEAFDVAESMCKRMSESIRKCADGEL